MINCPECGHEIDPEQLEGNNCPNCGTTLPDDLINLNESTPSEDEISQEERNNEEDDLSVELGGDELLEDLTGEGEEKNNKKKLWIVLSAVGLVVVLALVYWFTMMSGDDVKSGAVDTTDYDSLWGEKESLEDSLFEEDSPVLDEDSVLAVLGIDDTSSDSGGVIHDSVEKEEGLSDSLKDTTVMNDSVHVEDSLNNAIKSEINDSLQSEDSLLAKDTTEADTTEADSTLKEKLKTDSTKTEQAEIKKDTIKKEIAIQEKKKEEPRKKIVKKRRPGKKTITKKILPKPVVKKKTDIKTLYPQTMTVVLKNGKSFHDRVKFLRNTISVVTFSSNKSIRIPVMSIKKIKFYYEGPVGYSGGRGLYSVKADVETRDRGTYYKAIMQNTRFKTWKNGIFEVRNNEMRHSKLNNIDVLFIKGG